MPQRRDCAGSSTPWAVSSQTSPDVSSRPIRGRTRPATMRRIVDSPAPDGPTIASDPPLGTSRRTSSSNERSGVRTSSASDFPSPSVDELDRDEDRCADYDEDGPEREGAVEVAREAGEDRQRGGLSDPLEAAGEDQRRAELAERPPPRQRRAGRQRRQRERH